MYGEVGPFTSSSDPTTSAVNQQSFEIAFVDEASSAIAALEEEKDKEKKEGGNEEKEGGIRPLLRRLAEENSV